jgi:hypothetical protein
MQMGPDQAANHELWIFFADHDRGGNAVLHEFKDKLHLSTVLDDLARKSPILDLLICCCCRGVLDQVRFNGSFRVRFFFRSRQGNMNATKQFSISNFWVRFFYRSRQGKWIVRFFSISNFLLTAGSMYLCIMGPAANKLRSSSSSHHHLRIENSVSCSCWSIELHKLFLSSALI